MKRPGRYLIIVSLTAAVVITALGVCVFLRMKKPPGIGRRETMKHFSFSSARDLGEWREKRLAQNSTEYGLTEHEGKACVKAVSEDSASALFYRQQLSCDRDPFISWDWKAEKFPSRKNKETLDKKAEFDFTAQVYVIFHARFFLNARAIQYVWTRDISVGASAASPYTKNVRLLVLESGESDQWKHEERNIKEDFRSLFGEEPEKDVSAISFMTDADSTDSDAAAYYSNIEFGYLEIPRDDPKKAAAVKEEEKIKPEEEIKPEAITEERQPEAKKEPEMKEEPQPEIKKEVEEHVNH